MHPRLALGILSVVLAMMISSCAGPAPAASTATEIPQNSLATTIGNNQKPLGIIAIGHSGLTGESSDPSRLGQDAPENSWATGTNPPVNSIYQRLVSVEPEVEGHAANLAQGGAVARQLATQAKQALQLVPAPQLVIIQTIDNDIQCDGSDDKNVPVFGETLRKALESIVAAAPNSRILMVSQPGRPAGFAAAIASNPTARDKYEGNGICDLFNRDGSIDQDHINTLTSIIEAYEKEQERVCAAFPQCSTDHGAFTTYKDNIGDLAGDWTHLAVRGHAYLAEILWPIVAEELGVK